MKILLFVRSKYQSILDKKVICMYMRDLDLSDYNNSRDLLV